MYSCTAPGIANTSALPPLELVDSLLWVGRSQLLWWAQTLVAVISLAETAVVLYITYKVGGHR